MQGEMSGDLVKRGRKAAEQVVKTFEIRYQQHNGNTEYQKVFAVDFGDAGKKADAFGKALNVEVMGISQY